MSRRCRVCGCTDDRACPDGCYWVTSDLCSKCVNVLRLKSEMVDEVKRGRKRMEFRLKPKEPGYYLIEESETGADTGIVIKILRNFFVEDLLEFANEFYDVEGFDSAVECLNFIHKCYPEENFPRGYAHPFEVVEAPK